MKKLLLLSTLLFSTGVWADCKVTTHSNYSQCVKGEYVKSQNELKDILNEQYSVIPETSKNAFKASQSAWLEYRNKECEYQQSLNNTGSHSYDYASIDEMNCFINLNNQRIKIIQEN